MGKLFGTDGIRGVVNDGLDCGTAFRVGQALALVLANDEKPIVLIGKDTRISSDMLEAALTAGLCSAGADVVALGVIPTPAVAYLTQRNEADAGVVISASHNPYEHNGIKIFNGRGYKLSDELEDQIEQLVLSGESLPVKLDGEIGSISNGRYMVDQYVKYLASTVKKAPSGLKILVDCASGAAYETARSLFGLFDLDAEYIFNRPNGVNINDGCGSTHLDVLSGKVVDGKFDLGIALDGDADRVLVVDENGGQVDGDKIMAACAVAMKEENHLLGNAVVATVMSNLGFKAYLKDQGIEVHCADVGDRNVLEMMLEKGCVLGGEQSGHIIFLNHMTTGDGQLAALHFLSIVCKWGLPVSQLSKEIVDYPQVLMNIPAPKESEEKLRLIQCGRMREAIVKSEQELGETGRLLVRPSGTEAKIRVLVESEYAEIAQSVAENLSDIIKSLQVQ